MENYKVLSEQHVCVEYYTGKWDADMLIELRRQQMQDENFMSTHTSLIVYDNAQVTDSLSRSIRKYQSFLKENKKILGDRNVAIMYKDPKEAAMGILSRVLLSVFHRKMEVFSTLDAALQYLGMTPLKPLIEEEIDTLKQLS